ncbi:hypothetical protein LINPERHAP1_LOCUS3434 [Linum perenne]
MKNTKVNARNLPSITVLSVLLSGLRGGMSRGNRVTSQGPSELYSSRLNVVAAYVRVYACHKLLVDHVPSFWECNRIE